MTHGARGRMCIRAPRGPKIRAPEAAINRELAA